MPTIDSSVVPAGANGASPDTDAEDDDGMAPGLGVDALGRLQHQLRVQRMQQAVSAEWLDSFTTA